MFDEIDLAFYQRRAKEERALAEAATDLGAAKAHRELAEEYERKSHRLHNSTRFRSSTD